MDNQHKLIKGYRDLSQHEVNAMNNVKAEGERLGKLIEELRTITDVDQLWVLRAEEYLQLGIMSAVRSIAKPESF